MKELIFKPVGVVWLILMLATAISWAMGSGQAALGVDELIRPASIAMILIAFFKVRLVLMHFMEVKEAPNALRIICEAWSILVCASVILAYIYGGELAASGVF